MTAVPNTVDESVELGALDHDWTDESDALDLVDVDDDETLALDEDVEQEKTKRWVGSFTGGDDETMQYYLQDVSRYPLLTADEEKELGKRIQEGDECAFQRLVNSNLRLVVKIAKHYMSNDYPFVDIIQDGNLGLMRAARKFEYTRNVRFSTYAAWWIKQTIIRNLSIKKRMIRMPHRKEERIRRLNRLTTQFIQDYNRTPNEEELADALGVTTAEVRELQMNSGPVMSCDQPVGDDQSVLLDILPDSVNCPDRDVERQEVRAHVLEVLDSLPEREREILRLRFGFAQAHEDSTLKAMGERLGISAETVRQVELRVLRRIRQRHGHLKAFIR